VIAALLLRMGKASEPAAALNVFGKKRSESLVFCFHFEAQLSLNRLLSAELKTTEE